VLGLMGSGALLLMLGALLGITQIVSYPTAPLEDAGWVAMIAAYALAVLATAVAAFPKLYVAPAVAVILGVLLCGSAAVFPLVNVPLLSRPVGLFSMASFGLAGLASLAVAVALGRFGQRRSPPAALNERWRYAGLALAIVGAVGLALFLMVIANPGSILVFAAAISWSVALAVRLSAALRRARSA
jgi:hypothetical protein